MNLKISFAKEKQLNNSSLTKKSSKVVSVEQLLTLQGEALQTKL